VPEFRKLVDSHDYASAIAIAQLAAGKQPTRALSDLERLAIAVAATRPLQMMNINSELSRNDFMVGFQNLKKRLLSGRRPLVYFGSVARGIGPAGYHGHFLLWSYIHYATLHGHVRDLGLGRLHGARIDYDRPQDLPGLRVTTYVLGQQEGVFLTTEHDRHRDRPKSTRRFMHPQRRTLERERPKLLTALDLAKDPTLSDVALFQRCLTLLEDM
jgi:hypothetical protein